jgi:quercetin dioxygenase-like cupin family protein
VRLLSEPDAPLLIAEAVLPEGASPPLHIHDDLDDSFYILEGSMVVRSGDEVSFGTAGTWVPFPRSVPHTFRVIDRAARALLVHTNDSFMSAVRALGHPARQEEVPTTVGGPDPEVLTRTLALHGIRNIGPCMEADEAERWLQDLGRNK